VDRVEACYVHRVLDVDPGASGEVTVELRVRADGSVVDAKVKKSSFVNIAFHDCLSDVARGWRFPAFVGDDDTVLHSFRFTPRP
jgi:TonB family protein